MMGYGYNVSDRVFILMESRSEGLRNRGSVCGGETWRRVGIYM